MKWLPKMHGLTAFHLPLSVSIRTLRSNLSLVSVDGSWTQQRYLELKLSRLSWSRNPVRAAFASEMVCLSDFGSEVRSA